MRSPWTKTGSWGCNACGIFSCNRGVVRRSGGTGAVGGGDVVSGAGGGGCCWCGGEGGGRGKGASASARARARACARRTRGCTDRGLQRGAGSGKGKDTKAATGKATPHGSTPWRRERRDRREREKRRERRGLVCKIGLSMCHPPAPPSP